MVMRPPAPDPWMPERSTPSSSALRLAALFAFSSVPARGPVNGLSHLLHRLAGGIRGVLGRLLGQFRHVHHRDHTTRTRALDLCKVDAEFLGPTPGGVRGIDLPRLRFLGSLLHILDRDVSAGTRARDLREIEA